VKVLLDTHTLIWAVLAPEYLSRKASQIVTDSSNTVLVSAASAWEIATKVRLGKLPGAETFEKEFLKVIDIAGYSLINIDAATALRAGRFTVDHRDPFDRIIAAQALADDIPILSKDAKLDTFAIRRIW
jgi:PIN domain nuclease of toxin-antitoxin system